jgi:polysaccharide biosynthesis protein VpsQ
MVLFLKRFVFIALLIAYMTFIWIQSSYFNPEAMSIALSTRISWEVIMLLGISFELAHLFQFGVLYLLMIMVFVSFGELSKGMDIFAVTFALLYGFIDEIHQMYVPFRSASLTDLLKNTIGILAAWWFIRKYYIRNRETRIGRVLRWIRESAKNG